MKRVKWSVVLREGLTPWVVDESGSHVLHMVVELPRNDPRWRDLVNQRIHEASAIVEAHNRKL